MALGILITCLSLLSCGETAVFMAEYLKEIESRFHWQELPLCFLFLVGLSIVIDKNPKKKQENHVVPRKVGFPVSGRISSLHGLLSWFPPRSLA